MRKPGSDPMIMEAAFHLWSAATCRSFFSCDRQILLDVRGILRDSIKSGDKSPHSKLTAATPRGEPDLGDHAVMRQIGVG
jgi:hypothetical protein